jgi:hypothetical protein
MKSTYKSNWWSAEIPSGWSVEESDQCVSLFAESGIGALQVGAYRHETDIVSDDLLLGFADREFVRDAVPRRVSCGELSGFTLSYETDSRFWQKWWIGRGSLMLFVTYNCRSTDPHTEVVTVEEILGTLKSIAGAAT